MTGAALPDRLALLGSIERTTCDYCVLTPPEEIERGPVLDLLVEARGEREVAAIFTGASFRSLGRTDVARLFAGETAQGPLILAIRSEFLDRGIPYVREGFVMTRRRPAEKAPVPVPVPSDEDRLLMALGAWAREEGALCDPAARALAARGDLDRTYLEGHASEVGLGPVYAELRALASGGVERVPRALRARFRRRLVAHSGENASRLIRHAFSGRPRRGALVALLGPDGCGKSSTGRAAAAILGAVPGVRVRVAYLGPWGQIRLPTTRLCYKLGLVPEAIPWGRRLRARLLGRPETGDSLARCAWKAAKAEARGLVYYAAVWIELIFRYVRDVRPGLRRGGVVLAERYVYDLAFVHDSRAIEGYRVLRRLVCRLFPRPDLSILLDNEPEEIHRRKPQLEVEEIAHQRRAYREALAGLRHRVLKTERGLDAVAAEVAAAALDPERPLGSSVSI